MTKETNLIKPHESGYAAKVLNAMAGSINTQLAAFSSWMVAGFGAVLGLLVANIDTIAPFIPPTIIGGAVKLFLVAVVLNVFQRYLAAIVAGSVTVGKEVESIPSAGAGRNQLNRRGEERDCGTPGQGTPKA